MLGLIFQVRRTRCALRVLALTPERAYDLHRMHTKSISTLGRESPWLIQPVRRESVADVMGHVS